MISHQDLLIRLFKLNLISLRQHLWNIPTRTSNLSYSLIKGCLTLESIYGKPNICGMNHKDQSHQEVLN